jgi:hypothetical protein
VLRKTEIVGAVILIHTTEIKLFPYHAKKKDKIA